MSIKDKIFERIPARNSIKAVADRLKVTLAGSTRDGSIGIEEIFVLNILSHRSILTEL